MCSGLVYINAAVASSLRCAIRTHSQTNPRNHALDAKTVLPLARDTGVYRRHSVKILISTSLKKRLKMLGVALMRHHIIMFP